MKNPFALKQEIGPDVPREIFGYRPYVLAFSAAWASAMFGECFVLWLSCGRLLTQVVGYDAAFIGATITLDSFKRRYGLDVVSASQLSALSSNIVSTFQAGAFFGAILGFFLGERFGRKPIIMVTGVVFIVGCVLPFS
jgi:MFS family permease